MDTQHVYKWKKITLNGLCQFLHVLPFDNKVWRFLYLFTNDRRI